MPHPKTKRISPVIKVIISVIVILIILAFFSFFGLYLLFTVPTYVSYFSRLRFITDILSYPEPTLKTEVIKLLDQSPIGGLALSGNKQYWAYYLSQKSESSNGNQPYTVSLYLYDLATRNNILFRQNITPNESPKLAWKGNRLIFYSGRYDDLFKGQKPELDATSPHYCAEWEINDRQSIREIYIERANKQKLIDCYTGVFNQESNNYMKHLNETFFLSPDSSKSFSVEAHNYPLNMLGNKGGCFTFYSRDDCFVYDRLVVKNEKTGKTIGSYQPVYFYDDLPFWEPDSKHIYVGREQNNGYYVKRIIIEE